ncbi:MAG: hypothetical protein ACRCZB_10230, partial [Bacteroidales bacterium]
RNKKGQDFGKGSKKILLGGLKFLISLVPHSFSKNFYASFAAFFCPFPMSEGGRELSAGGKSTVCIIPVRENVLRMNRGLRVKPAMTVVGGWW